MLKGDGEYITLAQARDGGAVVRAWDRFLTAIINFLISAFVAFMLVRMVNRASRNR